METKQDLVDLSIIHEEVCNYFNLDKIEIFYPTRKKEIIKARQWFHYFCRELNPEQIVSLSFIGKHFSDVTGREYNHATVLHSVKTIKGYVSMYESDKEIDFIIKNKIIEKSNLKIRKPLATKVGNQHQQVLWYLFNWRSFSLAEVINDSMFYKFQTRLGEIEQEHGELCERSKKEFTNRFGRKSKHMIYDCANLEKAKELFEVYE